MFWGASTDRKYENNLLFLLPINYGIMFWGASTDFKRVFLVQKRFVRISFGMSFREFCRGVFSSHGILTATELYIYEILIHFMEYSLRDDFIFKHEYYTRRNNSEYPRHMLSLYENSPKYMGIRLYNGLPS